MTRPPRARELEAADAGYDLRRRVSVLEATVEALGEELEALRRASALAWHALEAAHARIPAQVAPPPTPAVSPERVPLATAARRLGVGASTVRRWIREGRLEGLGLPSGRRSLWTVATASLVALEQRGARGARERSAADSASNPPAAVTR